MLAYEYISNDKLIITYSSIVKIFRMKYCTKFNFERDKKKDDDINVGKITIHEEIIELFIFKQVFD